jgi:hypothetical protein
MTLNQTWKNCLRMWKWISEEWDCISSADVCQLKRQWMVEYMPGVPLISNCFFCDYDANHNTSMCDHCPGKLVSRSFDCTNRLSYNYVRQPKKFYKKLLQLDAKRRGKK